jgi:uncharacterized OsmC-like protein
MERAERIRSAIERNVKAVTLRPGIGQGTAVTRVRSLGGLKCEIEDGPWKLTADMSEKTGGDNTAPNPGVLGRAALGSCLVICYMTWAARLGVPITGVDVEVQADYDVRGEYGVADVRAGYLQVRYIVTVESDAPEVDVMRVLDEADAHSSYVDVFKDPGDLRREVHIVAKRS